MKLKFLVFILILLIQFSILSAHLDGGEEKIIDNYLVDFGYSPSKPLTNQTTFMSFNLVNDSTKEIINDLSSVWIRISNSKGITFSGEFKAENGNVFLNYKFPYEGDYEIISKFRDKDNTILETGFLINVESKNITTKIIFIKLIFSIILIILIIKYKKIKKWISKSMLQ